MTNNSTTKSKDSQSKPEPELFVFHLSNGAIIIGHVLDQDENLIYVHFPMQLSIILDSDGDFEGFSIMPYLIPFVEFNLETVVNFNINQIVSFSRPSPETIKQYVRILKKQSDDTDSDDDEFDLSSMEIPIIKH